jgi:hypothetical protein
VYGRVCSCSCVYACALFPALIRVRVLCMFINSRAHKKTTQRNHKRHILNRVLRGRHRGLCEHKQAYKIDKTLFMHTNTTARVHMRTSTYCNITHRRRTQRHTKTEKTHAYSPRAFSTAGRCEHKHTRTHAQTGALRTRVHNSTHTHMRTYWNEETDTHTRLLTACFTLGSGISRSSASPSTIVLTSSLTQPTFFGTVNVSP